jgi:hypothetical protein
MHSPNATTTNALTHARDEANQRPTMHCNRLVAAVTPA